MVIKYITLQPEAAILILKFLDFYGRLNGDADGDGIFIGKHEMNFSSSFERGMCIVSW